MKNTTEDAGARRGRVTKEHKAEAEALRELWRAYQARPEHLSQKDFGETYGIGKQAAVSHFILGRTALSLTAALGFAKGLGVDVAAFSPRLQAEKEALSSGKVKGGESPGDLLAREFDLLPAVLADGKRKFDYLSELIAEIRAQGVVPKRRQQSHAEPTPSPHADQKTQPGRARASKAGRSA